MGENVIAISTARAAGEAGLPPGSLARAAREGSLTRLRRGAYAAPSDLQAIGQSSRHRLLVRANRLAAAHEPVFSHESAAALHDIPLIGDWPDAVTTTGAHGGRRGPVTRFRRPLYPDEIVIAPDGTRYTSLARTAADLAARRSLLGGIVAMSHARFNGVRATEIEKVLTRLGPITGIRRARLALARSTAGSESALETLIIVRCQDYGFTLPEQQRRVVGIDGRTYRVDFAWDEGRIILEADGRAKYADPALRGDRTAEEVVWDEKRREDALRPTCDKFLRATWRDAWNGPELLRRLVEAGIPRTGRPFQALSY